MKNQRKPAIKFSKPFYGFEETRLFDRFNSPSRWRNTIEQLDQLKETENSPTFFFYQHGSMLNIRKLKIKKIH